MLYIYQDKEFKLTVDKSWMETTDGAFLYVFQEYKNNGVQKWAVWLLTGNVPNLFICFGKFWFQRQTVNMMKEVLMLDTEIQSWEGWGGVGVTGLFRRGAVSQSQSLRTLTRLCSVCGRLWSPWAPFELQQDGAAIMATQAEGSLMNFAQMLSAPGLDSSGSGGEIGSSSGSLPVPKSLKLMHSGQTNLTLSRPPPPTESPFPCFSATPTH